MIIELEDHLIKPQDVSCVTPIVRTIGPHAPGKATFFRVFFRGGGQILLHDEASRKKLTEAVKSCRVPSRSVLCLKSHLSADEFENRVQAIVTKMIRDIAP